MKYRLRVNGNETFVASSQELKQLLNFAHGKTFADLELTQMHEPERKPSLITRLLAPVMKLDLSLINEEDEIAVLINGNLAVVFYFEGRGDLFHSVSSDQIGSEGDTIDFYINTGEQIKHPKAWGISTEKAIEVLLEFYEYGERPQVIQWVEFGWDVE